jgi:hypothetical protein
MKSLKFYYIQGSFPFKKENEFLFLLLKFKDDSRFLGAQTYRTCHLLWRIDRHKKVWHLKLKTKEVGKEEFFNRNRVRSTYTKDAIKRDIQIQST